MQALKKTLVLVLTMAMIFCMSVPTLVNAVDTAFSDVSSDDWYADAVNYCSNNGLMNGTSENLFSPDDEMTRAMLITVLYRKAGSPEVSGNDDFSDTTDGEWYSDGVLWGVQQNIISGYGNGLFGTNDSVSREQLVTILWRQAGSPLSEKTNEFADNGEISDYAASAVNWAYNTGIVKGMENNRFTPNAAATRAQVATILMGMANLEAAGATPSPSDNNSAESGSASGSVSVRPSGGSSSGGGSSRPSGGGSSSTLTPTPTPTPAPPVTSNRAVVVYFSGTGTTRGVAQAIVNALGTDVADLHEIIPEQPYTTADLDYTNSNCRSVREQHDANARPAIANAIENIGQYDTVFLGYPIWNNDAPRIIYTFLENTDLAGKTIIPFCTSGGSSINNSVSNIRGLSDNAAWLTGRRCYSSDTVDTLKSWIDSLGLSFTQNIDDLALVNGGTFQMGSPTSELERGTDETQHSVTVASFYMSPTELTQKEYQDLMGSNPSENKGEDLPVTNITWYDAVNYCNALSEKEGLIPCYTITDTTVTWNKAANGYRLPTEAEWEYAARAKTTTPFSFGDYVHDEDANCYNAYGYNNDASGSWVNGYLQHTVNVDSYNANGFGLYNMHGNAAEWVWDWYGEYNANSAENPTGAESGNYKIARGGGWNDMPKHIRSAYRIAFPADVSLYSIGMRLVRNAATTSGEVKSIYGAKAEQTTGKTLIAYFSQTGNTDGFAKIIAEMSGADIFRIERKTPYSSSHNGTALYGEALNELRSGDLPELKAYLEDAGLDIKQYDTILLGYCNWWASIPAPVSSFLSHYDLSGKTIIPFCSMGGGRFGQGISMIAKLAPDSVIKEGLTVTYSSYDRDEIENWLKKNGIEKPAPTATPTPTPTEKPNRALTVYFSYTNNTESLAKKVQGVTNSDIYEINAKEPYTDEILEYYGDNRAYREQNNRSTRPEISSVPTNISDYDVIMLGFPIWYGYAPRVVCTFLESCDLSGKTIMPFCTSGSSGISSSVSEIQTLCPDSTVTAGLRGTASTTETEIQNWLDTSNFSSAVKKRVKLNAGGNEIVMKLNNSKTANSLVSMLPLTLNFSDYNSTEKIAYLPDTLDISDAPASFDPSIGDLTLYSPWGNLALFYKDFPSSSGLVPIGEVETGIEYMTSLAGEVTAELY